MFPSQENPTSADRASTSSAPDLPSMTAGTRWAQLGVVSAASFIVWAGFGAILPYLPIFLKDQAHSSMLMIGVIASMYYVGTLLFASPLGWLSDAFGRKPVIVAGVALYTVSMLLFTTTLEPLWFIVFRLLEGIGAAAVMPAGQAFIADITREKERSKAYGVLMTAQFGGLIVGPALAWPIYHAFGEGKSGFYAIFYIGAAGAALATLALLVFVHEPGSREASSRTRTRVSRPTREEILTPPILAFVLIAFTNHFSMGAFEVVWSIRLTDMGASLAYVSLTFVAFSVPMLLSFLGGILADRISRFVLMFTGFSIAAAAWVVYGTTIDLRLILAASVIEGLAVAFSYPAKQAFLIQVSPAPWRGTVVGMENTSMQLAGLIGTLTAPIIYGWMSGYVLALAGCISMLGLAVAAPVLHREWRHLKAAHGDPAVSDASQDQRRISL